MTSNIDPTLPAGAPKSYTVDVRDNFGYAKAEIEDLQARVTALEHVGEFGVWHLPTSNAVQLNSDVVRDVLTATLDQGDWDVQGALSTSGSSSNLSDIMVWVSTQSETLPAADDLSRFFISEINFGTGGQSGVDTRTQLMTGIVRVEVTTPITIYLSCKITWGSGTVLAAGSIRARRLG